jgi:hypothetical protein
VRGQRIAPSRAQKLKTVERKLHGFFVSSKGLVGYQKSGQFHFVTFSCYARQPNLGTRLVREVLERSAYLATGPVASEGFMEGIDDLPVQERDSVRELLAYAATRITTRH